MGHGLDLILTDLRGWFFRGLIRDQRVFKQYAGKENVTAGFFRKWHLQGPTRGTDVKNACNEKMSERDSTGYGEQLT